MAKLSVTFLFQNTLFFYHSYPVKRSHKPELKLPESKHHFLLPPLRDAAAAAHLRRDLIV